MKMNRSRLHPCVVSTLSRSPRQALLVLLCSAAFLPAAAAQSAASTSDVVSQAAAQAPFVPARVTETVDEGNLVPLHGTVHPAARPEFDRGPVDGSLAANRMVLLLQRSPDQEVALRQLLDDQQNKSSKSYHAWLSPDQFGRQFGPADSDIQAVTDWLTSRGFADVKVSPGRMRIEFSGNIAQVQSAFHTPIHHFLVNGTMHMASVSEAQIPAALAPVVAGVVSLHDFRPRSQARRLGTFRKTKSTGEVRPLFTFNDCGGQPCYAVGPGDFRTIYSVPYNAGTTDGTGVTIAIVQDSNLNPADVSAYRTLFGLPGTFTSSNIILNGPDPGIQGPSSLTDDELEADLDAQISGGVAPGATINVVVSENSQSVGVAGIDLSAIYVIDNNFAPILSESFGACETGLGSNGEAFYNSLWQQAAAQGITVILSSGDSGSDSCDQGSSNDFSTSGLSVSGLASTQYNVAIGGTDFLNGPSPSVFWNTTNAANTQISAKGYVPESTWNDSCAATATAATLNTVCSATIINQDTTNNPGIDLVGGGGGFSTLNSKPTWQAVMGNPGDGHRDIPDLSFFSGDGLNNSFYVVCQQDANTGTGSSTSSCDLNSPFQDFQGVGGTSAGAPAFAGIMALINQATHQRQGNANFVLYQLYKANQTTATKVCPSAASPAGTCIFYDITTGNNSVACKGGSTNCSNTSTAANQYGVLVEPSSLTTPAWTTIANYDLVTGLGSVNVTNLIAAWSTASFTGDTVAIACSAPGSTCSSSSAINVGHGANATFVVNVTPSSGGPPGGTISLIAQPPGKPEVAIGSFSQSSPITLSPGSPATTGTATITTNQLPGGSNYPVVASYGGDGTFAPGTSTAVNVTVAAEASKTTVSAVTFDASGNPIVNSGSVSLPYGSAYILQIAVADSNGNQCASKFVACPTGTVTLTDNGNPLKDFSGTNSASLNSQGIAEDQPVQLPVGANSLVAAYSGDNSFSASSSPATAVTITTAASTAAATASPNPALIGQNVTLTANISTQSSGVAPTGTVKFTSGTTTLGTANVTGTAASGQNTSSPTNASATATVTAAFSSSGAQAVTATYSGDTNYATSSATVNVTVNAGSQSTTTVVTPSATSIASGASITLTAKVTSGANNGPGVTGSVQFMNGSAALGSPAKCTAAAGTSSTPATCTATLMTTLSHLTPPPIATRRTPNLPLIPLVVVACLLFVALASSLRSLPTTKRLGYALAGALLFASVAVGIAACGGGSSSGGGGGGTSHTDSITAVYSGDANYAASTSAAVSITVQ
jgi:hypothetical protein